MGALRGSPVGALLLASAGVLLMVWELHRPGWVLPGVAGVGCVLLGGYGLGAGEARVWAVALLALGLAMLPAPWLFARGVVVGWAGVGVVMAAVGTLRGDGGAGWWAVALVDGAAVGGACVVLATAAGRARRAKLAVGERASGRGAEERWE